MWIVSKSPNSMSNLQVPTHTPTVYLIGFCISKEWEMSFKWFCDRILSISKKERQWQQMTCEYMHWGDNKLKGIFFFHFLLDLTQYYNSTGVSNETSIHFPFNDEPPIFDRIEVRAIFLVLYSIVFCSCFVGKFLVQNHVRFHLPKCLFA